MNNAPQSISTAPQHVYLSSALSVNSGGSNNNLTFFFNPPISVGDNAMPFIGLKQFIAFNGFANIAAASKNNILKLVNVMYNANTQTYDYSTYATQLTIPDNHYTNTDLFNYLQTVVPTVVDVTNISGVDWYTYTNDDDEQVSYLYLGLGFSGSNNDTTDVPIMAFAANTYDSGKTDLTPPSSSVYTKLSKTGETYSITTDPLVYAGLYLVYDTDTAGFLNAIGYDVFDMVILPNTNGLKGVGWQFPINAVPDETFVTTPDTIELAGPAILYPCLSSVNTSSRAGHTTLNARNILAQIPVNAEYGNMVVYDPSEIFFNYSPGLELGSVTFTFLDQYMNEVNFRGVDWYMVLVVSGRYSLSSMETRAGA